MTDVLLINMLAAKGIESSLHLSLEEIGHSALCSLLRETYDT